ncbi:PREDICTED: aquaporin-11 [Gekko japonicus]|uniref:Aquaporin-11 n=1 Tax=Gekko japonicus TaxID=146911 RepID=A0ABM1KR63_GEKJA|nr:PREDICTED: aquaporin-11 [Gekko japonicus]
MAAYDTCVSLLVMAATMALTACCRRLAHQFMHRKPHLYSFVLELSGAFQICACTHELRMLADLPPKPQMALALVYLFTTFHCLSLPGSINNPSSSFQLFCSNRSTVKAWALQSSAQFIGAVLAHVYIKSIWTLGAIPAHSSALGENCSGPIQTTVANAFLLELLFSFVFHLAVLKLESMEHRTKIHLLALLITALVYKGGHLTGAIFNPALAFSLHLSCFLEKFWNYTLVYWVAPCIGSVLVAVMWDEVIPLIRRHFNVQ